MLVIVNGPLFRAISFDNDHYQVTTTGHIFWLMPWVLFSKSFQVIRGDSNVSLTKCEKPYYLIMTSTDHRAQILTNAPILILIFFRSLSAIQTSRRGHTIPHDLSQRSLRIISPQPPLPEHHQRDRPLEVTTFDPVLQRGWRGWRLLGEGGVTGPAHEGGEETSSD